jgi:hypothetical protein
MGGGRGQVAQPGCIEITARRDHPLHRAGADAEFAGNLQDAIAFGAEPLDAFFDCWLYARPTKHNAIRARPGETRVDPLLDDAALELGEHAQHLKHRLAGGGRGVETLLVQEEVDTFVLQALQDGQQIGQRATEAIGQKCRPFLLE